MDGNRLLAALQALPDGGHCSVVVERDGLYYTVGWVELTPERFVLLRLASVSEGPAEILP